MKQTVDGNPDTTPPFQVARKITRSTSTAKHFASSLCQRGMQVSLFTLVSIRPCWDLVHSECKCNLLRWWERSSQTAPLYLSSIDRYHFCNSKWRHGIWLSVHYLFHIWLRRWWCQWLFPCCLCLTAIPWEYQKKICSMNAKIPPHKVTPILAFSSQL